MAMMRKNGFAKKWFFGRKGERWGCICNCVYPFVLVLAGWHSDAFIVLKL